MSKLPNEIDRINALTSNARNTWFALLGALVFVGMTLMGVEHIDFYGVNRATKLPLVDVSVPTFYFFAAAPILTAAIYGYFHLYLIRLWDAIGSARASYQDDDAKPGDKPRLLGDIIAPWLVTDAALQLRRVRRKENCTTPRLLEFLASFSNCLLSWFGGIIILYLLWTGSFPARTFWMSAISAVALGMAMTTGLTSLAMLWVRMRHPPPVIDSEQPFRWIKVVFNKSFLWRTGASALFITGLLYHSQQRTEGEIDKLAALNMIDQQIVERPSNWLPYRIAKAEFRAKWCSREKIPDCENLGPRQRLFLEEWDTRRSAARYVLNRPNLHKNRGSSPDFREAWLSSSFLAGANLWRADMEEAHLDYAQMEGAFLNFAKMVTTNFSGAGLEEANFSYSFLAGRPDRLNVLRSTDLSGAINEGGALRHVKFENVAFDGQTDFRNVFLDGTVAVSDAFAAQMGYPRARPCQWISSELSDEQYYSTWRWWIEMGPFHQTNPGARLWQKRVAPPGWEDVRVPTDQELADLGLMTCKWNTDPLPLNAD